MIDGSIAWAMARRTRASVNGARSTLKRSALVPSVGQIATSPFSFASACTARQRPVGMSLTSSWPATYSLKRVPSAGMTRNTTRSRWAGPRKCSAKRSSTTWSSRRHDTKRKAPVPTGWLAKPAPRLSVSSRGTIDAAS